MAISWQLGLLLYLSGGLICLAGMWVANWLMERMGEKNYWPERINAEIPTHQRRMQFLEAIATILLVWPLFVVFIIFLAVEKVHRFVVIGPKADQAQEVKTPASDPETDPIGNSHAQRATLVKPMSIEAIESAATYPAELDGVRPLPFGHLNAAWLAFKARLIPGDEVWQFTAPPQCNSCPPALDSGPKATLVTGFAIVRNSKIVDAFVDGYD